MNRRSWLKTAAGLLVAPAIVRAESLMPVRRIAAPTIVPGADYTSIQSDLLWGGGHAAKNYEGRLMTLSEDGPPIWEIVAGALPAGLTLHSWSGRITGVPKHGGSFTLRATNAQGYVDTPLVCLPRRWG